MKLGFNIFIKLKNHINARQLLELCYKDNVLFMPGDNFDQILKMTKIPMY